MGKSTPKISIIIPTFNSSKTILSLLLSIQIQNYKNIEIIVVDGESNDETLSIVKSTKQMFDVNNIHIILISEPDCGVYDAMNKGIKLSSGNFIYFIGADDLILPNALDSIIFNLKNQNTIYYGNAFFPKRNIIYDGKFSSYKLAMRNICHQAIFYPKSIFENYCYNLKYTSYADYDLNLKLWNDKNVHFEYLPHTISIFNDYCGISKVSSDINFDNVRLKLIKKNLGITISILYLFRRALGSKFRKLIQY